MADLKDLARDLRAFSRDLENAAHRTNRRIAAELEREAKKRSSGAFGSALLSEPPPGLNNPYGIGPHNARGVRGPVPYGDESIVNRQSGLFYRSWRVRSASLISKPGVPALILGNDAFYAKWLELGTARMIARPIDFHLRELMARIAPAIAAEEFGRAWKVRFDTK